MFLRLPHIRIRFDFLLWLCQTCTKLEIATVAHGRDCTRFSLRGSNLYWNRLQHPAFCNNSMGYFPSNGFCLSQVHCFSWGWIHIQFDDSFLLRLAASHFLQGTWCKTGPENNSERNWVALILNPLHISILHVHTHMLSLIGIYLLGNPLRELLRWEMGGQRTQV